MATVSRTTRSVRSAVVATLVVAVALAGAGGGAVATAPAATTGSSAAAAPGFATQDVEYDRFEVEITVAEDGAARWTFRYKRVLGNETERRNFEAFAAEFNATETEAYLNFEDRAARLTARAENASGIDRSMNATGFRKEAYVTGVTTDNLGVVEMSFRWTNAAATGPDGQVVLGDVFAGGFYLGSNQSMVVTAGEGLALERAEPEPASRVTGSVTYEGERTFNDRRPQVVFGPPTTGTTDGGAGGSGGTGGAGADDSGGTDGSGGTDTGGTDSTGGTAPPGDGDAGENPGVGDGGGLPLSWLALAVVLLVGIGAAVAYRTGAFDGLGGGTAGTTDDAPPGDGGAVAETAGTEAEPEPAVSDEELLSDEDRVVRLLEEQGGRMKQVNIVEATEWSKSKVSMLLSEMEEEGTISKLRIGRENVISLAGHEPEAAGSPFDDED
jgi:hypothetical protein